MKYLFLALVKKNTLLVNRIRDMLRNHVKMSIRNLSKRKLYSIINFVGLSLAMMITLLVYLFVKDELSYDRFHVKGDQLQLLYQIDYKQDNPILEPGLLKYGVNLGVQKTTSHNLPLLKMLSEKIPEIKDIIRIENNYGNIKIDGVVFNESINYVDQVFFEAFTYSFIQGQSKSALSNINDAVITEEIAIKYFGRTNVIGETITLEGENPRPFIVTGVLAMSQNTVLPLGIVVPIENSYYFNNFQENWHYNAISCFLLLENADQASVVSQKVSEIYKERFPDAISQRREALKLSENNPVVDYGLKPISDLYFDTSIDFIKSSSPLYSIILVGIAALILLIACINYLSISVSSSGGRQLEVAVRKVMGANRSHLNAQFYIEALLISVFSVLGGFTLMQFCLPKFNQLAGKSIELSLFDVFQIILFSLIFAILLAFLAGFYPAQVLSRFKVMNGLKGNSTYKIKPVLIRSMVVFQFVLCLFFISMSLTMRKQFQYISNKDLGFDKEHIVYVDDVWGKADLFGQALANEPSIDSYSAASGLFAGGGRSYANMTITSTEHRITRVRVGYGFFETMGIPILEGNSFDKDFTFEEQKGKGILNISLYNLLKQDSLQFNEWMKDTKGIAQDFHFESLQKSIGPIIFNLVDKTELSTLYVRLHPSKIEAGLAAIHSVIDQVAPNDQLEVKFLDSYLDSRYKDGQKWKEIINVASVLGVVIACIGLFGLTGINMANRTKEIGIRKVLGAGFSDILILLNRQTIWLIVLSTVLSLPISYYTIDRWLSGFAYRASITADIFLLSTLICFLVVVITVSFHSVKSTFSNPVDSLRHQ
jgi:putative ABC transport system permease protein